MAYIVERKINGNIYLYETVSYWDKNKKQPRQRSKYLGPKEKAATKKIKKALEQLVSKNYGNIFLLEEISKSIGLYEVLKECYPDIYKEILANAFYEILGESKNYLFHHFQGEHYLPEVKTMYSTDVSGLHLSLGNNEQSKYEFTKKWIEKINPQNGIYYDITSFSSYSTKNEFVEWGYNRDKENLPQINLGMVCCRKTGLPFFYTVFPGSIVDVKTIKNFIKYLKIYKLQDMFLILDKGFFSASNICELMESDRNLSLIIPLPFTLNLAKELIVNNIDVKNFQNTCACHSTSMFQYNEEILFHKAVPTSIKGHNFTAHIFFNEKAEVDQRHLFYSKILSHEAKIKQNKFKNQKAFETYVNDEISGNYKTYFCYDSSTKTVVRNEEKINEYLLKLGFFIIISGKTDLLKEDALSFYRNKDKVEKIFDNTKNEMNTNRLHSHSKVTTEGRIFVKFIATILYQQITKIMKEKDMFKKYSVTELLKELSKIKMISLPEQDDFTSECTKTQNDIFTKFNVAFKT
jgi:transposase